MNKNEKYEKLKDNYRGEYINFNVQFFWFLFYNNNVK